jgi:protein SCO1/2
LAAPLRAFPLVALALLTPLASACGGSSNGVAAAPIRPSAFAGTEVGDRRTAPGFALRDQDGRLLRLADERGRIVLATFLYTHCPDVCPLIAENLNEALRELGSARGGVRVFAVSVDPARDTPAAVRSYARIHRLLPQFHYLIGSRKELRPVWHAWHVSAVARDPDLVDHTAYTALIDQDGRERAIYDARVRARDVVHDVRLLLKEDGG